MNEHDAGSTARRFRNLVIEEFSRRVFLDDCEIKLTRLEFALLLALTDHPGTVSTPQQLLEAVWGYAWLGDDHVVETHVGRLRTKLGESGRTPNFIHTVRGVGYRFDGAASGPRVLSGHDFVDGHRPGLHLHHVQYDAAMVVRELEPTGWPVLGWRADEILDRFHLFTDDATVRGDQDVAISIASTLAATDSGRKPMAVRVLDSVGQPHVISSLMCFAPTVEGRFAGMVAHMLIDGGEAAGRGEWPDGAHGSLCCLHG